MRERRGSWGMNFGEARRERMNRRGVWGEVRVLGIGSQRGAPWANEPRGRLRRDAGQRRGFKRDAKPGWWESRRPVNLPLKSCA